MDVFYFFRGSGSVHLPFYRYNPPVFRQLIQNGGRWNNECRMFIFQHCIEIQKLQTLFPDVPFVQVDEDSNYIQVSGFLNQPVEIAPNENCIDAPLPEKTAGSPFEFPSLSLPPEKFSVCWKDRLETELRARKYSIQTRRAYIYYNRLICRSLQKTPEEIRSDDVTEFLASMEKSGKYSASAMNLAISAVKFFFRFILKKDDISERHRPHQDGRLPMVLSKEEVGKILGMEKNPKHRLLLMLVYSSGLRVSEVVALKKEHIDISRKVIYVRLGKGRKDRSTLLSERAAKFIEEYCDFFEIEKWLFPGQQPSHHLSIRSAQNIFDKALRHAGIIKKMSIHGLRHTFATHLLESGTDIRYIQSLLGHSNLRTTERYTHVARRNILNIQSPLDSIGLD
ncbi:MAG: site-specific integrase [Treponema sp.]|nr:site-specific integrase [Treponema sp.]MCL2209630.1 site-specific integrase [Treponema sp.]